MKMDLQALSKTFLLTTRDAGTWLGILNNCEHKDPFYLPEYLKIYENPGHRKSVRHFGGQGFLFRYGDDRNFIIYPFFKRDIRDLPFADSSVSGLYDIVSPYGYGGPLAQVENRSCYDELWGGFFRSFDRFCRENNIVSEFCRLHPLYENHRPVGIHSQGVVKRLGQIVYVDLCRSEEELFRGIEKGHRRRIRRARENSDLVFCLNEEKAHPEQFFALYKATMEKNRARNEYYFSRDFFETAFRTLGHALSFWSITCQGEVISVMLILRCGGLAYTWLSGAKEEALHLSPDNYMIYRSILQLKKEGLKYLVLGGGRSSTPDSLFSFKSGFSPLRKDFYVYSRVHLPEEYEKLKYLQGYTGKDSGDYFPVYRLCEHLASG